MSAAEGDAPLVELADRQLRELWKDSGVWQPAYERLPEDVRAAIARSVNSTTKTYRYVLPTQLLAKCVRSRLDCRSLQSGCGLEDAFDARTICHGVIVPFDRRNHDVLGGSAQPYVSKPARHPCVTPAYRGPQKNKAGWDDLMLVLDFAQAHPGRVRDLLGMVLYAIRQRLAQANVVYSVPNRPSLNATQRVVGEFLTHRSGGLRLQTVSHALFEIIGKRFALFSVVQSANINAADAATGKAADLECIDADGRVVLAVEVKDRQLTLVQVQDKLPSVRSKGVGELVFLVQNGIENPDVTAVESLIEHQFSGGHNIYVLDWQPFLHACLALFGETGRRTFLVCVGSRLDAVRADLSHREAWQDLLQGI